MVLRSERRLRPLTRLLAACGVWAALALGLASPLFAEGEGGLMTPAGTRIVNRATVEFTTMSGTVDAAASDSVVVTVGQVAGVDIEAPQAGNVPAGSQVVFAHVLSNIGNGSDVFDISAVGPAGWAAQLFHDVDGSGTLSAADTVVSGPVALAMGEAFPLLVAIDAPPGLGLGTEGVISLTATSRFDGSATDSLQDRVLVADFTSPNDRITVTKTVDLNAASPGDLLTYSIRSEVRGVGVVALSVVDTLPEDVVYEPGTMQLNGAPLTDGLDGDEGRYNPGTGVIDVQVPAPSPLTTVTFQVRVRPEVPAEVTITNLARGTVDLGTAGAGSDASSTTTRVTVANDLVIRKTVAGPNPARQGDTLVYVVEVENPSSTVAGVDLVVSDTLPSPLTVVDAVGADSLASDGVVRWTLARLEPGAVARFEVKALVGGVTDSVQVRNRADLVQDGTFVASTESQPTTLLPDTPTPAGVSVQKGVDLAVTSAGGLLTYTVILGVTGEETAAEVTLEDVLPAGLAYEPGSMTLDGVALSDGSDGDGGLFDADNGVLTLRLETPSVGTRTLIFQTRVRIPTPAGTVITNAARATLLLTGGETRTATDTATTVVAAPELTVRKTVAGPNPAQSGDTLLFVLEVENLSTDLPAYQVEVVDSLPLPLVQSGSGDADLSDDPRVFTTVVPSLAPGALARFTVPVLVGDTPDTLLVVNRVQVHAAGENGGSATSDTVVVLPPEFQGPPELFLDKSADRAAVSPGDRVTYTVAVRVQSAAPVQTLVLRDTLPAGLVFAEGSLLVDGVAATDALDGDAAHYDAVGRLVELRLADVADGAMVALAFQADVDRSLAVGTRITNQASAEVRTTTGLVDNATDTVTTVVAAPEIGMRKVLLDTLPATEGDTVRYLIEVTNPSVTLTALGLEVVDTLPHPLTAVRSAPEWTTLDIDERIVRWSVPSLAPGASTRIEVVARVGSVPDTMAVVNRAWVRQGGQEAGVVEADSLPLYPSIPASITLKLAAERLEIRVGETLPLTVAVGNDGDVTVSEVRVDIAIPEGTRVLDSLLVGTFSGRRASMQALESPLGVDGVDGTVPAQAPMETSVMALDSFRIQGDTLSVWVPGELRPEESFAFPYHLLINAGVGSVLRSEAVAQGRRGGVLAQAVGVVVASNQDEVVVVLERNRPLETRTVIGKVFEDTDGNGRQDEGEQGVAGAEIWTEDGEVVTTDAFGKYSLVNVRPGRHVLRLDPMTLPLGVRPTGEGATRGLVTLETTGWSSGLADFPVLPRLAVATDELSAPDSAGSRARLVLLPNASGWSDVAFPVPGGWAYQPGSATLGADAVVPTVTVAADGVTWLVWRGLSGAPRALEIEVVADGAPTRTTGEPVRIATARTAEERAGDKASEFIGGPAVSIFQPRDGLVSGTNKLYLGVRGEAGQAVTLFRGDSVLAEASLRPDGVQDFVALDLVRGPQTFRVRMTNSWGNERWDSVAVHFSGEAVSLVADSQVVAMVADGRSRGRVRVRVLDAWGVPVVHGPMVTVLVEGGRAVTPDAHAGSVGHQVRTDEQGWAVVDIVGGTQPGNGLVSLTLDDAEVLVPFEVTPAIRPLFLTGAGQVGLGAAGDGFAAVTARGRLDSRTSMTLSYDSRKLDQGRDAFGRTSDPLEDGRYTMIGDASQQRSQVTSRYRFFGRVERGQDWVTVGDLQSGWFTEGLGLARYVRSVPGAAARVTTGDVVWSGFGATTTQALRQRQFRGDGTSGPFTLDAGVIPGTDRLVLESRARENASRIVSQQNLSRFVDYEIDYATGRILLKRMLPAEDLSGNPLFLVATYEGESGGQQSVVAGLRASADVARFTGGRASTAPVAVSVVHDAQPGSAFTLGALQAGMQSEGGASFSAEVALASGVDSTDVAARLDGALPLLAGRLLLTAQWTHVGDEFSNPSNVAVRAGSRELRGGAEFSVDGTNVTAAYESQDFPTSQLERSRASVSARRKLAEELDVSVRLAEDRSGRNGASSSATAGEIRTNWQATSKLRVFAEGRDELRASGDMAGQGSFVGGGASYQLMSKLALEGRQHWVRPNGGGSPFSVASLGVTSKLRSGTKAWGSYQIAGGVDGRTNAAVLGLNHQFQLGSDWRLQGALERRSGVGGAAPGDPVLTAPFQREEEDYVAVGVGAEYLPTDKPYRLSIRGETKHGNELASQLLTIVGDVSFAASLGLLTRQEFMQRDQLFGGRPQYARQRASIWGLAYRPTGRNDLNVLFKFEWRDGINPFGLGLLTQQGEESRKISALEAIWTPAAAVEVGGRVAFRQTVSVQRTGESELRNSSDTRFLGSHARIALRSSLDLEVTARGLLGDTDGAAAWDIAPALVFTPLGGIEVEAGYRFGELQDPDFAVRSGSGWYMSLGFQITEGTLPSAAAFWRNRFGG